MTPNDVYVLVDARSLAILRMVVFGIAVLLLQCILFVAAWRFRVKPLYEKIKILVRIAEMHGFLNETGNARLKAMLVQTNEVVDKAKAMMPPATQEFLEKAKVELPPVVADEVIRRQQELGDSHKGL